MNMEPNVKKAVGDFILKHRQNMSDEEIANSISRILMVHITPATIAYIYKTLVADGRASPRPSGPKNTG